MAANKQLQMISRERITMNISVRVRFLRPRVRILRLEVNLSQRQRTSFQKLALRIQHISSAFRLKRKFRPIIIIVVMKEIILRTTTSTVRDCNQLKLNPLWCWYIVPYLVGYCLACRRNVDKCSPRGAII